MRHEQGFLKSFLFNTGNALLSGVLITDSIALLNYIFLKTSVKLNIFDNQNSLFRFRFRVSELKKWTNVFYWSSCMQTQFGFFVLIGFTGMCILKKTKTLRATSHLCDLQKLYLGESENISPSFQEMV